jgi:hypothetical protein
MSQYKELDGLSGYYITDDGRVFHGERELKTYRDKDSYVLIGITVKRKTTTYKVHRLVAQAFIDNPDNLPEVNHIDGNKWNNCVDNLEWVSHRENLRHASEKRLFRYGEDHPHSKLSQQEADHIRNLYGTGNYTQMELSKMFNSSPMVVNRIVNNKTYLKVVTQ